MSHIGLSNYFRRALLGVVSLECDLSKIATDLHVARLLVKTNYVNKYLVRQCSGD